MLLSLVYKERREKVTNKLVEFIYQLSAEDVKVAVKILKEPICIINRGKQLTLSVMIIKLDNMLQT